MEIAAVESGLVDEAVRAIGRGDHGTARSLLLRASEAAPDLDRVWLWLAQISSSPTDKASYLRRVLALHPGHEVARSGLADALRDEGVASARRGSRRRARALLERSIELEGHCEETWLWLAAVAVSEEERRRALARVLELVPGHRQALELLALLDRRNGEELSPPDSSETSLKGAPEEPIGEAKDEKDTDEGLNALISQVALGWDWAQITYDRSGKMASIKESLQKLSEVDGFIGACLVDSNSGMMMGSEGGGSVNMEAAAAGNTEVVRAKRKTIAALGLKESIEDILITLGKQYHLIRPLAEREGLFIYLVLDKGRSNLALARHRLADAERDLVV